MHKLSITDLDFENKKVLMRVDFNVPLKEDGSISDDTRIKAAIPSIKYVLDHGGSVILMSHLGRPKGEINPKFSLRPCQERLAELLDMPVIIAPDVIGEKVEVLVNSLKPNQVMLLENLRFYKAEENPKTDPSFAKSLAKLGDIYINDAFGTAHRKHSSTYTIAQYFPNKSAAGFLMEKEIKFLGASLKNPKKPFYAIIGGSKISTKTGVIMNLLNKVDGLFIGGGMTYVFLKAKGINIGKSIVENDMIEVAKNILQQCKEQNIDLNLAEDIVIADDFNNDAHTRIINSKDGIPDNWEGMDTGPKTIEKWTEKLKKAQTILWNGPLGVFELPSFAKGTYSLARELANVAATTIVGGGDSVAAINSLGLADKFTHLSTGGGASLEYIEFGRLPGIDALSDK